MKLFSCIIKMSALFALVACGNGGNDRQDLRNQLEAIQNQNLRNRQNNVNQRMQQQNLRNNPLSEETRREREENVEKFKARHGQVILTGPMIDGDNISSKMSNIIIVEDSDGELITNGKYEGKSVKDKIKTSKDGESETKLVDFRTHFNYSPTKEALSIFTNNKNVRGGGSRTIVLNKEACLKEMPVNEEKTDEERIEEYIETAMEKDFDKKGFKVDVHYVEESETYFTKKNWFRGALNGEANHIAAVNAILCGDVSSTELVKVTAIAENVILMNFTYRMQSHSYSTMSFEIAAKNLYLIGKNVVESHPMPKGDFEPPHIRVETQSMPKSSTGKVGSLKIVAEGATVE